MSNEREPTGTITSLLRQARDGDACARATLFERAYPEMQRMARAFLVKNGRTFAETATVMVNRVCMSLLAREPLAGNDRRHFFRLFGRMMHDILVEEIRATFAQKRGGKLRRQEVVEELEAGHGEAFDLIDLREGMDELRVHDPDAADVINLRFFCGQTIEEAASTLGCSFATARQHADYGIAWLRTRLSR